MVAADLLLMDRYGNLIKPAIEIVSFSAQVSAAALLSALLGLGWAA